MGDAPRQRGKSEVCTLNTPRGKAASTSAVKICPYAQVTIQSAPTAASAAAWSRTRAKSNTGTPASCAATFMGLGVRIRFRPVGLSGWVRTAATQKPASRRARNGMGERGSEPAKTIFIQLLIQLFAAKCAAVSL